MLYTNLLNTNAVEINDMTIGIEFPNGMTSFGKTVLERPENKNELNDEIANLLKDISAKGRNLKKYKKVEDLEDYKKLIQSLLKKVVSSTEKVEKKATFRNGQKNFKLHLQIINKNLLELTREFMKQQKSVIAVATKIDSIEGLLLDLLS